MRYCYYSSSYSHYYYSNISRIYSGRRRETTNEQKGLTTTTSTTSSRHQQKPTTKPTPLIITYLGYPYWGCFLLQFSPLPDDGIIVQRHGCHPRTRNSYSLFILVSLVVSFLPSSSSPTCFFRPRVYVKSKNNCTCSSTVCM